MEELIEHHLGDAAQHALADAGDETADLHVGVITSSLGSHGTGACSTTLYGAHMDDHGHLLPRPGEMGTTGYTVSSVGGMPMAASCPSQVQASPVSWAYDASATAVLDVSNGVAVGRFLPGVSLMPADGMRREDEPVQASPDQARPSSSQSS